MEAYNTDEIYEFKKLNAKSSPSVYSIWTLASTEVKISVQKIPSKSVKGEKWKVA